MPVERSPMISSRWPRPIGIIESIALRPVCSGSFTGWRSTTPGALNSSGRNCSAPIGPPPVERIPERVDDAPDERVADRHARDAGPLRRTAEPSSIRSQSPKSAAPTLSDSRLRASPVTPCSNSSISMAKAVLEAVDARDAVADLEYGADLGQVRLDVVLLDPLLEDRGDLFRAKFHLCASLLCVQWVLYAAGCELLAEGVEAAAHARVRAERAGLEDDAADQARDRPISSPRRSGPKPARSSR